MSDPQPGPPSGEERAVLERLRALLWQLGSANDAQDHGAAGEAVQLRRTAGAAIQELLREHSFLTAMFPNLGAELGTWRLEAFGWSELADVVERRLRFVNVELIPWDRVVHFAGRAGEVPEWIAALGTASHAAAAQRLDECLVSAGRVTQATPLAVRLMLGALRFGLLKDAAAVRGIVRRIDAAARLQVASAARGATTLPRADWSLFTDDRLWPPFESVGRDEALWKDWRPSAEEALGWALLTGRLIDEHEQACRRLGPAVSLVAAIRAAAGAGMERHPDVDKAPRLFRVILPVADMARAEAFYTELLGLTGRRVAPQRHYFDAGGVILALVDPRGEEGASDVRPNQEHVYFAVSDLESVHARAAALAALDRDMGAIARRPWGERSFYAHDPFGNPLCFVDETTLFTGR